MFSMFDDFPHIKKIYLKTVANYLNKKAKDFYQHIGFTQFIRGRFIIDEGEPDSDDGNIVYLYEKN